MRTRYKILLAVVVVLLGAWLLVTQLFVPRWIRHELSSAVAESCPTCRLEIESISLSPLLTSISFSHPDLTLGDPRDTEVKATAAQVRVALRPLALFNKELHLREVVVEAPDVTLIEGDGRGEDEPDKEKSDWIIRVDSTQVREGKFSYVRVHQGRRAPIRITEISATVGPAGQSITAATKGTATGMLEAQSPFTLTVEAPLFAGVTSVDVDLVLDHLPLADMNPFFGASEGLRLKGVLHHGRAVVNVRERSLEAWVRAQYKDLGLDFESTKDRGAFAAFFSDLFASIALRSSVMKEGAAEQTRGVTLQRGSESLVSFIFRGMKEAALRVATDD